MVSQWNCKDITKVREICHYDIMLDGIIEYREKKYFARTEIERKNGYPVYRVHDVPDDIMAKVMDRSYPEKDDDVPDYCHPVTIRKALMGYPVIAEYIDCGDDIVYFDVDRERLKGMIYSSLSKKNAEVRDSSVSADWNAIIDTIYKYRASRELPAVECFYNYPDSTYIDYYDLFWDRWGEFESIGFDLENNIVVLNPKTIDNGIISLNGEIAITVANAEHRSEYLTRLDQVLSMHST